MLDSDWEHGKDHDDITAGEIYTVERMMTLSLGSNQGVLIRLVEAPLPKNEWFCSCGFREIDEDDEEQTRETETPRELEPA
jgi:hypothetical protein